MSLIRNESAWELTVGLFYFVVLDAFPSPSCILFSLRLDLTTMSVHGNWESRDLGLLFLMISQHYHVFYIFRLGAR